MKTSLPLPAHIAWSDASPPAGSPASTIAGAEPTVWDADDPAIRSQPERLLVEKGAIDDLCDGMRAGTLPADALRRALLKRMPDTGQSVLGMRSGRYDADSLTAVFVHLQGPRVGALLSEAALRDLLDATLDLPVDRMPPASAADHELTVHRQLSTFLGLLTPMISGSRISGPTARLLLLGTPAQPSRFIQSMRVAGPAFFAHLDLHLAGVPKAVVSFDERRALKEQAGRSTALPHPWYSRFQPLIACVHRPASTRAGQTAPPPTA